MDPIFCAIPVTVNVNLEAPVRYSKNGLSFLIHKELKHGNWFLKLEVLHGTVLNVIARKGKDLLPEIDVPSFDGTAINDKILDSLLQILKVKCENCEECTKYAILLSNLKNQRINAKALNLPHLDLFSEDYKIVQALMPKILVDEFNASKSGTQKHYKKIFVIKNANENYLNLILYFSYESDRKLEITSDVPANLKLMKHMPWNFSLPVEISCKISNKKKYKIKAFWTRSLAPIFKLHIQKIAGIYVKGVDKFNSLLFPLYGSRIVTVVFDLNYFPEFAPRSMQKEIEKEKKMAKILKQKEVEVLKKASETASTTPLLTMEEIQNPKKAEAVQNASKIEAASATAPAMMDGILKQKEIKAWKKALEIKAALSTPHLTMEEILKQKEVEGMKNASEIRAALFTPSSKMGDMLKQNKASEVETDLSTPHLTMEEILKQKKIEALKKASEVEAAPPSMMAEIRMQKKAIEIQAALSAPLLKMPEIMKQKEAESVKKDSETQAALTNLSLMMEDIPNQKKASEVKAAPTTPSLMMTEILKQKKASEVKAAPITPSLMMEGKLKQLKSKAVKKASEVEAAPTSPLLTIEEILKEIEALTKALQVEAVPTTPSLKMTEILKEKKASEVKATPTTPSLMMGGKLKQLKSKAVKKASQVEATPATPPAMISLNESKNSLKSLNFGKASKKPFQTTLFSYPEKDGTKESLRESFVNPGKNTFISASASDGISLPFHASLIATSPHNAIPKSISINFPSKILKIANNLFCGIPDENFAGSEIEVFNFAKAFHVDLLKEMCIESMERNISAKNVYEIQKFALEENLEILKRKCCDFIYYQNEFIF